VWFEPVQPSFCSGMRPLYLYIYPCRYYGYQYPHCDDRCPE
jgi:hypothetical protein